MSDTDVSLELGKVTLGECLRNQPSIGAGLYSIAVAHGNAAALLTTVLQSEECKEDKSGYVYSAAVNSKDATALTHRSTAHYRLLPPFGQSRRVVL